ncbi:hypothetical protein L7F22_056884, partial [Adiantum nelumboides]|nr:hypothetical protein [Adiantum nelumboides]
MDYFNCKGFHSIFLQLTIATNCSIWNYDVEWAGSVHDSLNFTRSELGQKCVKGELGKYCLVGDCAYPARPYMLVPFKGCKEGISHQRYHWNFIPSSTRMAVKRAFGMLKARFGILLKRCDMDLHNVPDVVACLVLHNICICHGDSFDMEWVRDAETSLMTGNGMEEHRRVVARSMVELQACRLIQEEDVVARAQRDAELGGQGNVINDLGFGGKHCDNLA